MEGFQIKLKNEKSKQYEKIALFILLINLALFIYIAFTSGIRSIRIAAWIGVALILTALIIDHFLSSIKKNNGTPYKLFASYAITLTWVRMDIWWAAGACFLLGTFYFIAKRPLLVSISKDKIEYPAFPKKKISWNELNNIILKDHLLTIDFRNNRFIQQAIDETNLINEKDFNEFCRKQLTIDN